MSETQGDNGRGDRPGKATGPRSVAGKDRSKVNGWRHGARRRADHAAVPLVRHCPLRPCECPQAEVPCPLLARMWSEGYRRILALPHVRPAHALTARVVMDNAITIRVIRLLTQQTGMFRVADGLDVQPALKVLWTAENAMMRALRELGLTPMAAHELRLTDPIDIGGDPALALQAALEQREREAEEAEPGDGGPEGAP